MTDGKLTVKQSQFVVAFVDNELTGGKLSNTDVALSVGYSAKTAYERAADLLRLPQVIRAIADRKTWLAEQEAGPTLDARRVIREWTELAIADPTQVVTIRRVNCRYCWGVGHLYQWTAAEFARESADELNQANPDLDRFAGGDGFQRLRDPHPHCPECSGEGVEDLHVADFRKLKGPAKRLIAGVKQGRHGLEITFRDQDAALLNLARTLGLVVNKGELSGPGGGPIPTANVNYNLPADPVEASRVYQQLMEGKR